MTLTQVLHIKDKQRSEAEAKAEARTIALCKEIPALSEIDRQLAAYGPALVGFAIAGNKEAIANLEKENLELQERRIPRECIPSSSSLNSSKVPYSAAMPR